MKILSSVILSSVFCLLFFSGQAQNKLVKSTKQNYVRGLAEAKFAESGEVLIDYDLDKKMIDLKYLTTIPDYLEGIKPMTLKLAFVDKESNAPAIYAETLDKEIASVLIYDDKIEVKFRNGDLSTFSGLQASEKSSSPTAPSKTQPTKPKTTK